MTTCLKNLIALLTSAQVSAAKNRCYVYLTNAAHGKQIIAAGYQVVKENSRNYYLAFSLVTELAEFLNVHGIAVKVVIVEDKYSDNNGAYELATLEDVNGKQFTINNMYDSGVCFRSMTESEIIAYSIAN